MSLSPELKPCPFCGGRAEIIERAGRQAVRCADLYCGGMRRVALPGEDGIAEWNARAQASPLPPVGWEPIETAPKNATDILVCMPTDMISPSLVPLVAHWADGGGEDQPRYKGWFRYDGYKGFVELRNKPTLWRPLPEPPPVSGASHG